MLGRETPGKGFLFFLIKIRFAERTVERPPAKVSLPGATYGTRQINFFFHIFGLIFFLELSNSN